MNRRNFLLSSASLVGALEAAATDSRRAAPDHAALLAHHDVVYLTPTEQKSESLPIGNGDLVGMVAMPTRGLELVINKANLWDDRPNDPPLSTNWAWDAIEEEKWTTIVTGAHLSIRSGVPILDPLYLDSFEARLNLHRAEAQVASSSALGTLKAAAWVSTQPAVLAIDYDESANEPVSREIELERWGSRRLFHWYSQYDPLATGTGLDGTRAGADEEHVWIEQKLRAVSFAVVARFVGAKCRTMVRSAHAAVIETPREKRLTGRLYLSIVTSEEDPNPLAAARRNIAGAVAQGLDAVRDGHRKHWADFWSKSYVGIPEDQLENLYYFSLYQLAASSQGAYPPTHCGGLWFWNRDIRRWGHYYHWNVQQQYWPVHSANHPELARPYLEFRSKTLPQAEEYARRVHHRGGAFYSDVTDRSGRGTVHEHVTWILTAGPQIAMDLWRHYQYTHDLEFLRSHAYPVMRATAQFYLETLDRDASGTFHVPKSTGYENYIVQRDTISDLAIIRQHFPACIRASQLLGVDAELRPRLAEILDHLAPFTVMNDATDEDGKKLPPVFSSGLPLVDAKVGPDPHHRWNKQRQVKKGERQFNISFYVENAPVFPSGVIGLGQRGTGLFDVAINTAVALGPGPAWNSLPAISLARLGRGDDSFGILAEMVEHYQRYPQGYFAELTEVHEASGNRFDMSRPSRLINLKRTEPRAMLPGWWFDYPDLELGGVLMTTINEMLMQSYDGVIRIFPAVPASWKNAAFQLRAVGAFLVTGELREGAVQPYVIESLRGGECRTEPPWKDVKIKDLKTGAAIAFSRAPVGNSAVIAFSPSAGSQYLISSADGSETLPHGPVPGKANQAPKEWKGHRIGIPKQF